MLDCVFCRIPNCLFHFFGIPPVPFADKLPGLKLLWRAVSKPTFVSDNQDVHKYLVGKGHYDEHFVFAVQVSVNLADSITRGWLDNQGLFLMHYRVFYL